LIPTLSATPSQTPPSVAAFENLKPPIAENLNLDKIVRQHIHYVLDLNHGNKLRTARHLGISRSTLYRILEGSRP
jgi:DNA-binding NtrC family response regulator